ncbi:MAG: hypothetical protein V1856_00470 [Candidatus Liptonbacteria bacterium]
MENFCPDKKYARRGQLLMELLLAVSALAILGGLAAQMVIVSIRGNRVSNERGVAQGLMNETLEAVRSVAEEKWQNIYNLTKSSQHYYPVASSTRWIVTAGDENVSANGITYTRYLVVNDVSRDASRDIENSYNAANDDPSTQKITVSVSWPNADALSNDIYILRWRNKVCAQADWFSGGATGVKNCPETTYDTKTNITASSSLELCAGGC